MNKFIPVVLASRYFEMADQELFSRISGDSNPIHLDSIHARRSLVGEVVVHGMHTLLWALDQLALSNYGPTSLSNLDVRFPKPAFLGEEIILTLQNIDGVNIRLNATVGQKTVAIIRLGGPPPSQVSKPIELGKLRYIDYAKANSLKNMLLQQGVVPYAVSTDQFINLFPAAANRFGATTLLELAGCSCLVGMQCPGLSSIFSRLTLSWQKRGAITPLEFQVTEVDPMFSRVLIFVQGAAVSGTIEAFSPRQPPRQLTMGELSKNIDPRRFEGQTALIIGGSRGLGELTAKAIAAGGGKCFITYSVGKIDAQAVVDEIQKFGGDASCYQLDITQPVAPQLKFIGSKIPTHLYYFASCKISKAKSHEFDVAVLNKFIDFYIHGYSELCEALWSLKVKNLACLYPSSIFVEDIPEGMIEYAMAKAAGEILATEIGNIYPGYYSSAPRLPRLLTDQTLGVMIEDFLPAIDCLLPILYSLHQGK